MIDHYLRKVHNQRGELKTLQDLQPGFTEVGR